LEEVLVIEPNSVTVLPAVATVGVTPSVSWAAGPAACAKATTDKTLRAAIATNHLNENLSIRNISSQMCLHTNRPRGTTGLGYVVQVA
jgi:hypothetical protein